MVAGAGGGLEEGVWATTSDAVVRRWDPRQQREVPRCPFPVPLSLRWRGACEALVLWDHAEPVTQLLPAAGDTLLVTASEDRTCRVWDVRNNGQGLKVFPGVDPSCAVACRGGAVAFQDDLGQLAVFRLDSLERAQYRLEPSPSHAPWGVLALTEDGDAVTGTSQGVVRCWVGQSLGEARCTAESVVYGCAISALCVMPGNRIAIGDSNGSCRLWDPAKPHGLSVFKGHHAAVASLQAGGRWLTSFAEGEQAARAWCVGGPDPDAECEAGPHSTLYEYS